MKAPSALSEVTAEKNPWVPYWDADDFWNHTSLWRLNAEVLAHSLLEGGYAASGTRLLNLGCGPGELELRLAPLVQSVTAADISESFLSICRSQTSGLSNVRTEKLEAENYTALGSLGGPYDLIVASSVIQYYRSEEEVLRLVQSASEIASTGGRMILADIPLVRSMAERFWDYARSACRALGRGYFLAWIRLVMGWMLHSRYYRRLSRKKPPLEFDCGKLQQALCSQGFFCRRVDLPASVYAGRPALEITF